MIDQAGRIPLDVAIEVPLLGEIKNVNRSRSVLLVLFELLPRPLFALLLVDAITNLFDEVLLPLDRLDAINTLSVNLGSPDFHKVTLTPFAELFDAELLLVPGELAVLFFLFAHFNLKRIYLSSSSSVLISGN